MLSKSDVIYRHKLVHKNKTSPQATVQLRYLSTSVTSIMNKKPQQCNTFLNNYKGIQNQKA